MASVPWIEACNIGRLHIDGLEQDCSNSISNALELLQSCTKPLIWCPNDTLVSIIIIGLFVNCYLCTFEIQAITYSDADLMP